MLFSPPLLRRLRAPILRAAQRSHSYRQPLLHSSCLTLLPVLEESSVDKHRLLALLLALTSSSVAQCGATKQEKLEKAGQARGQLRLAFGVPAATATANSPAGNAESADDSEVEADTRGLFARGLFATSITDYIQASTARAQLPADHLGFVRLCVSLFVFVLVLTVPLAQ